MPLALLMLACARSPTPAPPAAEPAARADGLPCLASTDCASGVCEGEGCGDDTPGVCVGSMRACTRDLRAYCGCDGETFRTSGSCPNRRFEHRGVCASDTAPPKLPVDAPPATP